MLIFNQPLETVQLILLTKIRNDLPADFTAFCKLALAIATSEEYLQEFTSRNDEY
jgi:hypothetical protein